MAELDVILVLGNSLDDPIGTISLNAKRTTLNAALPFPGSPRLRCSLSQSTRYALCSMLSAVLAGLTRLTIIAILTEVTIIVKCEDLTPSQPLYFLTNGKQVNIITVYAKYKREES